VFPTYSDMLREIRRLPGTDWNKGAGMKDMVHGHSIRLFLIAIAAGGLAACSSMPTPDTAVPDVSAFHAPLQSHVLQPGERITLVAFNAEGLSGDYVVGEDGNVDLGRYGKVAARGLTAPQLEEAISAVLAGKGLTEARVSVMPEAG